ncbi:MAG: hypothetical protein ABSD89_13300 [Halobacteriota archaeon]
MAQDPQFEELANRPAQGAIAIAAVVAGCLHAAKEPKQRPFVIGRP